MVHPQLAPRRTCLRRQWRICRDPPALPFFLKIPLRFGYVLQIHEDANALQFHAGERRSFFIGVAARDDRIGPLLADDEALSFHASPEKLLESIAGVYNLIVEDAESIRIYSDPAGMANVFIGDETIASCPGLFECLERDPSIDADYRFGGTDDWYPGELTPFKQIRCLPANHELAVPGFARRRFWPSPLVPPPTPVDQCISDIARRIVTSLTNVDRDFHPWYSITGGRDSRVNLAAALSGGLAVRAFTIDSVGRGERQIVHQLVEMSGVKHTLLQPVPPDPVLLQEYDQISGGMSTGARRTHVSTCEPLSGERSVHVNGNLGAIFKAFFWPRAEPTRLNPEAVLRDFLQRPACIVQAVESAIASLPPMRPRDALNLIYMEHRGGRWMGIGERAAQLLYDSFTPLASRAIFDLTLSLPSDALRNGRVLEDLVSLLTPSLGSVSYASGTSRLRRLLPRRVKHVLSRALRLKNASRARS